ncbi:hypothetical protein RLOC_00008717 [Lonchura striata]|uniref:Uncharacterized protein n=1 Tax=Lonchura striata TaxID=40157 RepID=A0A218VE43_9PASE|nr:hypothetical protein RLOC_00008717 [Lonchura striata domestica]
MWQRKGAWGAPRPSFFLGSSQLAALFRLSKDKAFVFLSTDARGEESTKSMQKDPTSAGRSRTSADAPFCSTSSLPSAMASLRSIPPQHPTSSLPSSGAAQPQLHCTKDKEIKYPPAHAPEGHGVPVVIPKASARRILCEPFLSNVKWSRLPLAG